MSITKKSRALNRINGQITRKADELAVAVREGKPWQSIQKEIAALRKNVETKAAEPDIVMECTRCNVQLGDDYFIVNAYESIEMPGLSGKILRLHLPFCASCNDAMLAEYAEED